MARHSKLYFALAALAGVLLVVIFAGQAQPAALTSPLGLVQGDLRQESRRVEFTVVTSRPVDLGTLEALPDFSSGSSRYVCMELTGKSGTPGVRVCAGPGNRAGIIPQDDPGTEPSTVDAELLQPETGRLTVRVGYRDLNLDPGSYRFRFVTSDGSCGGKPDDDCVDAIPAGEGASFNLRVPALVGCTGATGQEVRHGPRDRKAVALTFDDGPGASTRDILRILREKRVDATFFLLGSMISEDPEAVRQIPRQGSEVANHSTAHQARPGRSDLENTNRLVEEASGVTPCAYRPPYGDVNGNVVSAARAAGLDTVLWDVDTNDWQSSTTIDSILENVKANTQNGSIILMHDGGDEPRPKTVELLPRLIDLLRSEGYTLLTVSELLGNEITWEPLGEP